MHPPSWICRTLHRIHPQLRLAWAGRPPKYDGELNPGSFSLVQLYHIQDCGSFEEPTSFRELWDVGWVQGEDGTSKPKRVARGPIFSKDGSCRPDWDPLFRKAVYVANLDDFGFTLEQVLSGYFLLAVQEWLTPIERRVRESAQDKGRQLARDADAIAGEMTDFLWREAQKPDAAHIPLAHKHAKEELRAWERQKRVAAELPQYYMPPKR